MYDTHELDKADREDLGWVLCFNLTDSKRRFECPAFKDLEKNGGTSRFAQPVESVSPA